MLSFVEPHCVIREMSCWSSDVLHSWVPGLSGSSIITIIFLHLLHFRIAELASARCDWVLHYFLP